jgi:ribose transport system ATP-binding protein
VTPGPAPAADPRPPGTDHALVIRGLSKHFDGMLALDGLDLTVEPGEIHGVVGQNGSGKSTLVKVLTGYHQPDGLDELSVWGSPLAVPVRDPARHGITVVHQDLGLCEQLSALENIALGFRYSRPALGLVTMRRYRADAAARCQDLGIGLDLDAAVSELTAGERASLCVVRALEQMRRSWSGSPLLILDEPTAYLSQTESERVYTLMREVVRQGGSVVLISHRLGEIRTVADRVTVLRDGRVVGVHDCRQVSEEELIGEMLGRQIGQFYPDRRSARPGRPLLTAENLSGTVVSDVGLQVRAGEIVGVTGLVGMGQDELPYLLAGVQPATAGSVRLGSVAGDGGAPRSARLALVPGNRHRDGLWLRATAAENFTLPRLRSYFSRGTLRRRAEESSALAGMQQIGVRPPLPALPAAAFSGGNQQKVVLAKWLATHPDLLLLHEPTQGVDAGAKKDILQTISDSADAGVGVLICSADHEQIARTCDRVIVLSDGAMTSELTGDQVTEEMIVRACHATEGARTATTPEDSS